MNSSERNALFLKNFALVTKICKRIANHIHRNFPGMPFDDLMEYAYKGIIEALDKADVNNPGFEHYLGKYGYNSALEGVGLMFGLPHRRTKEQSKELSVRVFSVEPNELNEYIESTQVFDWGDLSFDEINRKIDFEWLLRSTVGSYEYLVLRALLRGLSLKDMFVLYGLKVRRIRKYAVRLCQIYICAAINKPFNQYLTRIRRKQIKRIVVKRMCGKMYNLKKHNLVFIKHLNKGVKLVPKFDLKKLKLILLIMYEAFHV